MIIALSVELAAAGWPDPYLATAEEMLADLRFARHTNDSIMEPSDLGPSSARAVTRKRCPSGCGL
jgi:hypothetical protein